VRGVILRGMTDADRDETRDDAPVVPVTLTTGRIAEDAVGALADALETAGVAVTRRTFLPTRDDETSPWSARRPCNRTPRRYSCAHCRAGDRTGYRPGPDDGPA